jgi:glycosyltransferase involved in cell wall biosynthesis
VTGINLCGYLRTESGVGEIARRYARALDALGLPIAHVDLSRLSGNRAADRSIAAFADDCPHDVSIVCIDVHQHHALLAERGPSFFEGRYNIGVWLWETPKFPSKWLDRFAYYDEIWAPSSFIAGVLGPIAPVPVVTMPPVLTVAEPGSRERGRLALNVRDDEFLCAFVFDMNSTAARKNPLAVLDAFNRAFSPADCARLVVKFVNGASDPATVREMARAAAGRRISLLDGYWQAGDVQDLLAASDAYVSLHRSEGVGLTITDALALGKPVVATDWSGNRDFMTVRNAFPVAYSLTTNRRKAGPYAKDTTWAEPSVEHAADRLRWIFEHRDDAAARGGHARADIAAGYAPAPVAARIRTRLDSIANRRRGIEYRSEMREVYARYARLGGDLQALVERHVPSGERVAVISKGDDRLVAFEAVSGSHFPQLEDGSYAGHYPADSDAAIAHLDSVRGRGVTWLAVPATAAWWLDHYPQFAAHLSARHGIAVNDPEVGLLVRLAPADRLEVHSEEACEVRS